MMRTVLLFLCVFYIKQTTAIIGGSGTNVYAFPFAAAIDVQTSNSKFFCGGTLISNQFVITAGQCVNGAVLFTVHLGSVYRSQPRVTLATSEYFLHPDFNPLTLENDIALIKFRLPVEYSDFLKPMDFLAIAPIPETPTNDTYTRIIGWGQTSDDTAELAELLNFVNIVPMPNSICRLTYGNQVTDNMVCVDGNFNEGACYGDIGGPLIEYTYTPSNHYHVGVSSFLSANGCESTDPSGYTRTYPYIEWIQNITSSV